MRALSATELTRLRTTATAALPDTCTISRATSVSDGGGGQTPTWATAATVACRLAPRLARPQEGATADRQQNATDWIITVPQGTDVRVDDRIVIGSRTFEVAKSLARSYQTALQVLAVEVV